jgi:23S rRNA (guanosine2251-2'-O)-methyltransferase
VETKEIIGRNPVLEYLRALEERHGGELFISKSAHGKIIDVIVREAKQRGVRISYCEKDVLAKVDSSSRHQGVMLRLAARTRLPREEDFLDEVAAASGLIVALDRISDPHNVGSIIRSAEALGASGVALSRAHSAEVTPVVVKASAGATAHLPVLTVSNVAQFLERAKARGFWIIGASGEGESSPEDVAEVRPAVLVIGSEGEGMRRLTEHKCDYMVRIPLRGNIASLNASVAAGIILYELLKRHTD